MYNTYISHQLAAAELSMLAPTQTPLPRPRAGYVSPSPMAPSSSGIRPPQWVFRAVLILLLITRGYVSPPITHHPHHQQKTRAAVPAFIGKTLVGVCRSRRRRRFVVGAL